MKSILFYLIKILTINSSLEKTKNNSLLILMFHQVNDKNHNFYKAMPTTVFKELCLFIKKNYAILLPSEVESHFNNNKKSAAIISFDDGHYDIIKNALPILRELEIPFNINIDTEILKTSKPQDFVRVYDILNNCNINKYYNSEFMENAIEIDKSYPVKVEKEFSKILSKLSVIQRRKFTDKMALDVNMDEGKYSKMLSLEDLKLLDKYKVEFGSHSYSHPVLTNLSSPEIYFELKSSKNELEAITNQDVNILAYPNGAHNEEIYNIAVDMGYKILLKTEDKINIINKKQDVIVSWSRINQYHQKLNEALAHTYGKTKFFNSLRNYFKK